MLAAGIYTDEEFIAYKGLEACRSRITAYGESFGELCRLNSREYSAAVPAFPPSPGAVEALLGAGVRDVSLITTVDAYHDNMLTYRERKSQWKSSGGAGISRRYLVEDLNNFSQTKKVLEVPRGLARCHL
jgi:hypothetical protein